MTHLKKGLWGVLATPFAGPSFDVDTDSLRREVALYTGIPSTGMVVLGVFGEGSTLDTAEQRGIRATVTASASEI